jgi:hypothetical protein
MNIFHTDTDPVISAQNLDDLRVNKMIIESAALLANAIAYYGGKSSDLPISKMSNKPFKTKAWQNHPSCIWVKKSRGNYNWLLTHTKALIDEMIVRKGTTHSMSSNIDTLTSSSLLIPEGEITDFANCTPYKDIKDTIQAYKSAMVYKWEHDYKIPVWSNRQRPDWYNQEMIDITSKTPGEFSWTGIRSPKSKR